MPSRHSDRGRMLAKALREDPEFETGKMLAEFSEPYGTISAVATIVEDPENASWTDYLAAAPLIGIPARALKKMEGLSTAARKAMLKEAGFDVDTVLYHGTKSDVPIDEFRPSLPSSDPSRAAGSGSRFIDDSGVWVTEDPMMASSYAQNYNRKKGDNMGFGGQVVPVYARGDSKISPTSKYQSTTNRLYNPEDIISIYANELRKGQ